MTPIIILEWVAAGLGIIFLFLVHLLGFGLFLMLVNNFSEIK